MKTKQEVIQFLESKVGTKVKCVGNASLDGMCVTLIKAVMEFIGVPDPYKARGHAKTCISAYINEGIAKQGTGFLTVFSNKNMGAGYGHVWCNAGDGNGEFYESNGVKALTVTKGKTYSYDMVCNFDQYITDNTYRGYDLSNTDSMKICVDDHIRVVEGQLVDKSQYEAIKGQLTKSEEQNEELSRQLGIKTAEAKANFDEVQKRDAVINTLNEAISKMNNTDNFAKAVTDEQEAHNITKSKLDSLLWDMEDTLKLSHTSTDIGERIFVALATLGKLHQTITVYEEKVKTLESEVKKLTTQSRHISKLTISQVIIILIDKLKEKYGKK